MVRATFKQEERKISLKLDGHAGAAEEGSDIVCSAASILAYTVAQTLMFMHGEGDLKEKPHIKLEKGDAFIEAVTDEESYAEVLHTFFVAQVGYHLLSLTYPQHVELNSFGRHDA